MLRSASALVFMSLVLGSCGAGKQGPPAIGEAFVGPATLNLRQDLAPKSPVVAAVKHGEKLEVVQTRRRFVRVRTSAGAIGWTDSRQLLSTAQMDELQKLKESAAKLPGQGLATVYEAVNIHTEPNRISPSFAQISETSPAQVVGHLLAPKVSPVPAAPVVAPPKPAAPKRKPKKPDSSRVPPPPMPSPPPLPKDWLELSRSAVAEPGAETEFAREAADNTRASQREREDAAQNVPMEDWSLVRLKDGRTGWVLTRLLIMSIPDEVAQYAEGHRITSYFALADVPDGDQLKHHWLWTTIGSGGRDYEFDSFRVFIWNVRRHRYETAHIERNLRGYYPVEAKPASGKDPGRFSLIVEKDGQLWKKSYVFAGYRVSLASTEPHELPLRTPAQASSPAATAQPHPSEPGLIEHLKERARSIIKH